MYTGISKSFFHLLAVVSFLLIIACDGSQENSRNTHDVQTDLIGNRILDRYIELSQKESVSPQESYSFLMAYCNRFLSNGGESKQEIETFLIAHIGERAAGHGFVNLVKNEIDIPFTKELKSRMKAGDDTEEALFYHSEILFEVLNIHQKRQKTQTDWEHIVSLFNTADNILPSYSYHNIRTLAFEELNMNRKLFELNAYRSFDLGKDRSSGLLELRRLWRRIEGEKRSFREEIISVNTIVMEDIVNRSEPRMDFQLDDEVFLVGDSKESFIVDFESETSPVYRKNLAVAVFSTTCPYCEEELKILSNLSSQYSESLTIVALRGRDDEEIESYGRKNRITVPLLINNQSRILEELDVSPVPVLFLFNDEGKLIKKVRFRNQANIEDKIRWVLDDAVF